MDVDELLDSTNPNNLDDPKFTENALTVLKRRYLLTDEDGNVDETPNEMLWRVASTIAKPSAKYGASAWDVKDLALRFYNAMATRKFMPNSPTLTGAGTELGMLSACFVYPIEDTMTSEDGDGILDTAKNAALTHKAGGGTGFNFSKLRPKGDPVQSTNGVASGPVSFLRMYSDMTNTMKQGGTRRGANMGILRVNHPDIMRFINCKAEGGEIENFNISVAVTDEFMRRAREGEEYDLVFDGEVYDTLNASDVLDQIIENAHANGEPGLFFVDRTNNPIPHMGEIRATNPCQPAWATVLTPDGISTMGDVEVGDTVWSGKQWTTVTNKVNNGNKKVYAYETTAGTFYGTEDHRVLSEGDKIPVDEAGKVDLARGPQAKDRPYIDKQAIMDGLVVGDGQVARQWNDPKIALAIGEGDQDYFDSEVADLIRGELSISESTNYEVVSSINPDELDRNFNREVPERYLFGSTHEMRGFLRGLFSADGTVLEHYNRVVLKSASKRLIKQVQRMLSAIGVRSYYTTNQEEEVEFKNGTYTCRESYDLNITTDRDVFAEKVNFLQEYKRDRLKTTLESSTRDGRKSHEIINKEEVSEEEVYDITVGASEHTYWTNGLLVSNCGEQPLPPYGSCNLGHVNLAEYITQDGIDWDGLADMVRRGVLFLDNVIDANEYPLPEVRERIDKTRRIGLGVMGWADALINRGIPYDSEEALDFADKVASFIANEAIEASRELAEERGTFPAWEESEYEYPRRNAYLTTVAPTGTTSILGGTSGGIEPNFAFAFERHQADTEMVEVHESVRDRHGTEISSDMSLSEIRSLVADDDVLVSAHEIDPHWHIRHQAAWQKHIETGISKTINYSESATPDDVREGYMLADELGCKGITVYRDGTREGQALSMGDEDDSEGADGLGNGTEDRPSTLTGQTTKIESPEGDGYLTINEKHGLPFEVFLNIGKTGGSVMAIAEGYGRLISLALRNGIDLAKVYEQLRGIGSRNEQGFGENRVGSLPDAVAQALQEYIDDDVEADVSDAGTALASCPDCGSDLRMQEGCKTCIECGYSKCG